jgi:hypothetical protein
LRAVKRGGVGVDEAQQLVAVRARHHQHELGVAWPVELVTGRLEGSHGGFARFAGEGVLGLIDDQRHGAFGGFNQGAQGIGQCAAIGAANFGGVDLDAAHADAFQPCGAGGFGHHTELLQERTAYSFSNQTAGVALLVGPQVHVHHHHLAVRQLRHEVGLQKRGFARAPWRGQEQAVGCITEGGFALQGVCQRGGKRGARVVEHQLSFNINF